MLRAVRRRSRWAHAPVIHAASRFDHEKRVAWVPISMHTCGSVSIIMVLRLATLRAAGALLIFSYCSHMRRRLTAVLTVSVTSVTVSVVRAVIPRAASSAGVGRRL